MRRNKTPQGRQTADGQKQGSVPGEGRGFIKTLAKRLLLFTLAVLLLFLFAHIINSFNIFNVSRSYYDDTGAVVGYDMLMSFTTLVIIFFFLWLIGALLMAWGSWQAERQRRLFAARLDLKDKAALRKTILRRYRNNFLGSVALYTLVLCLLFVMMFLVKESRVWYAEDPLYPFFKFIQEVSPFAGVAFWVTGLAVVLYRQWRQGASDVVGLIDSIEQMQGDGPGATIEVPATLPEVQPVVQGIYDEAQADKRAAEEAEQRKNELIAYLAHDLKTPLTSVIGYLSLLEEQPDMPTEQRAEYGHIALDKALRLEKLIDQFFEISRYNMREMVLDAARIDLKYLLVQLTDEFYPILEPLGKSITLTAPDELWLEGDAGKLARVLGNIIRNAVAYGYPQSAIEIEAWRNDTHVVVAVANSGPDIPPEQLDALFNKFFRLDDARGSDTGGAGLGLAIAREIVTLHGGAIKAQSENERVVFTVALPTPN